PFKVLVGRDNLAANGLEIPGVFGMVFSGTTTGDWTLSCARGDVTSVTYVFDDGTIRTLSSDDNSLARRSRAREGGGGGNQNRPIGWISDRRGIPCVTGKRISNASSFLAARIFAKGLEAGAQAFGQSQTTRQVSPLTGVNTTTVTGDTGEYVASQIASGGVGEISDYLRERMAQSFDVIYVDTGGELAVHIDRELPIDYEPDGRKLTYARKAIHTRRDRLD
ncbi:MAG: TIGR03752 family integrating conjugative element protein, partial [Rhodobacteraceae bacterium]|nr:TIGR03752 family integrating conjugative element protein [Paracoccaceae bacterium]